MYFANYTFWAPLVFLFFATSSAIEFDIYQHTHVPENMLGDASDSVMLYKYMNGEYYSLIGVGHPAKQFKVTFDTTWGDSWLPSAHCAFTEIACQVHDKYDSSKSSTYKPDGRIFKREDADFSLSGFFSVDNFHLAHMSVENQTFVEVTKMSSKPFLASKADGIIGLSFASLSTRGTVPFMYNLIQQGKVDDQVFSFYMNRDPTTEKAGTLLVGARNRKHIKGEMNFVPVIEKKYWTVKMDRVTLTSPNQNFTFCANGCNAIFDTGSNQIVGPTDEINRLNNLIHAKEIAPFWPYRRTVDCRTAAQLPHVQFTLNGHEYTIESKYYVQHLTLYAFTVCLSPFTVGSEDAWILGGAFLMQFYSEFDIRTGQVGLAETVF